MHVHMSVHGDLRQPLLTYSFCVYRFSGLECIWQEPGVDDFYKVVQKHWGKLLPALENPVPVIVVDLTNTSPGTKVKKQIDDVIKVEDDDDDLEEQEFKALPEDDLSVEEIQQKIDYLRCSACAYLHVWLRLGLDTGTDEKHVQRSLCNKVNCVFRCSYDEWDLCGRHMGA